MKTTWAIKMLLIIIPLLTANSTAADTYKCDAVESLARLGYDGGQRVSIVGQDKVCKFSIGGASADGMGSPTDFQQGRTDRQMLTADPESFISQRLATVILESAFSLGETADFVFENLEDDIDLSDLSCSRGEAISVGSLEIRCLIFFDANSEGAQAFENGIITALLFRPTFIFDILDRQTNATALVIFIPRDQ